MPKPSTGVFRTALPLTTFALLVTAAPLLSQGTVPAALFETMEWRSIGPYRGGRVVAVAGHPREPMVFYFGATGGGVWKTTDGGWNWKNVSDGYFKTGSVGAIALAESSPDVIYVGMGEGCIRGNLSPGDGVYKSGDGGKTWQHLGLADTQHIGRIRIDPQNPDRVYVAALGHAWGPNAERGVFRTKDGGKTWEKVLFRSERAGAIDLTMDPTNPRVLYASLWQVQRYPWGLRNGGDESGIFKTTDGGDTWRELSGNPGLPKGIRSRIGVAVSPARPNRVWAIIEAMDDKGVFRSEDAGATWERVSDQPELLSRNWYYYHIFADTRDPDVLYVLNSSAFKSTDGGKSWTRWPTPHGDNHDLWIDPKNSKRLIEGNDGGATISFNGGESWSTVMNQPTAQIYHVITDTQSPYRIYGAQQDNTTLSIASRSDQGSITETDWYPVGGGESGYIAVRPDDPNVVFSHTMASPMTRYDHRTRQARDITVWPEYHTGWGAQDLKYRFQWTYPIVLSPHDPGVLYATGNHVFRSTNEGQSWEVISPDLSGDDPSKLGPTPRYGSEGTGEYWGPISREAISVEYYALVFTFAESPVEKGLLWAGTDDGLLHVSRDAGKNWTNVTPPDLPKLALMSIAEPSHHAAGSLYLAATRYKLDDYRPYLYKTNDYGKTWQKITRGLPEDEYTRVVREDPVRRGLLYAGTEKGVYVSFNDGEAWQPLKLNLPVVPIHDLAVKEDDLIAATHGRSFWILDNVTPLREASDAVVASGMHLFKPEPTTRFPAGASGAARA